MKKSVITLTTDFGTKDAYAAAMKGVILSINPSVSIVDISHDIRPQNIREGAYLLNSARDYFPKGTVHIAVVDPGVGSPRKILCVKTAAAFFIAPDNGILTPILQSEKKAEIRELKNSSCFLKKVSGTFHGRDKMAPAAAYLSFKKIFNKLGPIVRHYEQILWPQPVIRGREIKGEVIYVDHFGNLMTNIQSRQVTVFKKTPVEITVGKKRVETFVDSYAEGKKGQLSALLNNSSDNLEIAARDGSAARIAKASAGSAVTLKW